MAAKNGRLVLVVGPSGSGKDRLLRAARDRLADDPRFVFPRRVITRATHMPGEDHIHTTLEAFQSSEEGNAFFLHWHAHGHHYGVPGYIEHQLELGKVAIVNVSRNLLETAREHYPDLQVIRIHTSLDTAFKRLQERGRESEDEIAHRLKRHELPVPDDMDMIEIENEGTIEEAMTQFLDALERCAH